MNIIPRACVICGDYAEKDSLFCDECGKYSLSLSRACPQCGSFLPLPSYSCHFCAVYSTPAIDHFFSPYLYAGAISKAITSMKYPGSMKMASILGRHLAHLLPHSYREASLILYPPMAKMDRYKRGFNQAAIFAEKVSEFNSIPLELGAIKKKRKTGHQASLHGKERIKNLDGAFELSKPIKADRVIIIDDVITTGSTVNEIGKVLKRAGVKEVYAISLARTSLYFS